MSAEEKAKELVDKFTLNPQTKAEKQRAKDCAAICVKEILEAHFMKRNSGYKTFWIDVLGVLKSIEIES